MITKNALPNVPKISPSYELWGQRDLHFTLNDPDGPYMAELGDIE